MVRNKFTTHIGQRFTRWLVIDQQKIKSRNTVVPCRCDCGVEREVQIARLFRGRSKSCGCLQKQLVTKHGHMAAGIRGTSSEYVIWVSMRQRTSNPKSQYYENYGGRGISVCERWNSFENFYSDMGPRPSKNHSIERIDNSLGYDPRNCKWATKAEQNRNSRRNHILTFNGITMCAAEWAREVGLKEGTICHRIKLGWGAEKVLTAPLRGKR